MKLIIQHFGAREELAKGVENVMSPRVINVFEIEKLISVTLCATNVYVIIDHYHTFPPIFLILYVS